MPETGKSSDAESGIVFIQSGFCSSTAIEPSANLGTLFADKENEAALVANRGWFARPKSGLGITTVAYRDITQEMKQEYHTGY